MSHIGAGCNPAEVLENQAIVFAHACSVYDKKQKILWHEQLIFWTKNSLSGDHILRHSFPPHFVEPEHFAYGVNNEFNAVVVEALFSDKQLFIGKGAGSYPTASAVLSDISAIKFDYKYEYRKTSEDNAVEFTNDFFLKVYIGSPFVEAINEIPFYRVDELFQSDNYAYQTGWVKFSDLKAHNLNHRKELSLIVLPNAFKLVEGLLNENVERRRVALEV